MLVFNHVVAKLLLLVLLGSNLEANQGSLANAEKVVVNYEGRLMTSQDAGTTWQNISAGLPEYSTIKDIAFGKSKIYVGYNKDSIFSKDLASTDQWQVEDLDMYMVNQSVGKMLSRIFTTNKNIYAEVIFGKLFRKASRSHAYWQPLDKPDEYQVISELKEDAKENVFIATSYGLFVSKDDCKSWQHIFKMATVFDFEIIDNEIFVSSNQGIFSSHDMGQNWQAHNLVHDGFKMVNHQANSYKFIATNHELIAIKDYNVRSLLNNIRIQSFNLKEKKWAIHPANNYVGSLPFANSIVIEGNNIYCGYAEGIVLSQDNGKKWTKILNYNAKDNNSALKIIKANGAIYCVEVSGGC
ncbi:MAG: hypothetical protein RLZZ546_1239 [Bacteroidota bacterium]|jgi:photosystem II stability/assembly factor-like uncharacterized protein